jgi:hypothetical protein
MASIRVKISPSISTISLSALSRTEEPNHHWYATGVTHFTMDAKNIKKWHAMLSVRDDVEILCSPQNTDRPLNSFVF